ncbi:hypothetical protein LTR53_002532 [Teratosphaeriaceae sp. CCFEE 6253]|nr:hypothetical protein LTR53_002532 [Teratosphaeriaceae sp. CCFEE 6253]
MTTRLTPLRSQIRVHTAPCPITQQPVAPSRRAESPTTLEPLAPKRQDKMVSVAIWLEMVAERQLQATMEAELAPELAADAARAAADAARDAAAAAAREAARAAARAAAAAPRNPAAAARVAAAAQRELDAELFGDDHDTDIPAPQARGLVLPPFPAAAPSHFAATDSASTRMPASLPPTPGLARPRNSTAAPRQAAASESAPSRKRKARTVEVIDLTADEAVVITEARPAKRARSNVAAAAPRSLAGAETSAGHKGKGKGRDVNGPAAPTPAPIPAPLPAPPRAAPVPRSRTVAAAPSAVAPVMSTGRMPEHEVRRVTGVNSALGLALGRKKRAWEA